MELRGLLLHWYQLLVIGSLAAAWPDYKPPQLGFRLADTLEWVFRRTYDERNLTIFISTDYKHLEPKQTKMAEFVLTLCLRRMHTMVPFVLDTQLRPSLAVHVQMQLLFVQSVDQVESATALMSSATRSTKYLIVLLTSSNEWAAQREMSRIFGYFLHQRYNVNVLLLLAHMAQSTLRAFTFYPYTASECAAKEPQPVPMLQPLLAPFPKKLLSFHGCPLTVIVWHIAPYVELPEFRGHDAAILRTLAHNLNFSMALRPNEPPTLLGGDVLANGTLTGAYGMLRDRRANITLGCSACNPARSAQLTPTMPYAQIQYIIVLRAAQSYNNYEIMLCPFDRVIWLLLGVLIMLRLLLRPPARFRRPLRASWLLLLFVLRSSYEGCIFDFVHNMPAKPLPRTFDQLLQQGYSIIVDHATYRMAMAIPRLNHITRIVPGEPIDVFDALLDQPPRTAVFSSKTFLAYYLTKRQQRRSAFVILHEGIVDNMICLYFTRGSYLADRFGRPLLNMRSFGLLTHFSKRFETANLPGTTADGRHATTSTNSIGGPGGFSESMRFLISALLCLLISQIAALCIFAVECLSRRYRWLDCLLRRL